MDIFLELELEAFVTEGRALKVPFITLATKEPSCHAARQQQSVKRQVGKLTRKHMLLCFVHCTKFFALFIKVLLFQYALQHVQN